MSGWQVQDLDLTGRDGRADRARPARLAVPRLHDLRPRRRAACGPAARCSSRRCPTCRSTRGGRSSTRRPSSTTVSSEGYDHTARRPHLRLVAAGGDGHDLRRLLAKSAARQLDRRRARGVHPQATDRRRDGRPRADPRGPGVRRARRASPTVSPTSGLTVATGGGPGAMEAANLGARLGRRGPDGPRGGARRRSPQVPSFQPDVTAWAEGRARRGRGTRRLGPVARHPDLALRPRAAEPVQLGGGEVLPQRHPRGRAARGQSGPGWCSSPAPPARCRRSSRRRAATTTPPRTRWCRWCSSARTTGRARCRPGR